MWGLFKGSVYLRVPFDLKSQHILNLSQQLQCDYYNWDHPDKVDQLDDRKITIHSEKGSCQFIITTKRNQQHGSKSTNSNLQT